MRWRLAALICILPAQYASAQATYPFTVDSGAFGTGSVWNTGTAPDTATENAIIRNGKAVTVGAGDDIVLGGLGAGHSGDANPGGIGTLTMTGGILTTVTSGGLDGGFTIGASRGATFTQTGGTVTVGGNAAVGFYYTQNGEDALWDLGGSGAVDIAGDLMIGRYEQANAYATGNAGFAQAGDSSVAVGGNLVLGSVNSAGTGAYSYRLGGGTLTVDGVITGNSYGQRSFLFDGGTLVAGGDHDSGAGFISGLSEVSIAEGGARIDTGGHAVLVAAPLLHAGSGTDGGLTKLGAGTLRLTGTNLYDGGTVVKEGLIAVAADAALGAAAGGLTLDGGGLRFDAAFGLAATRALTLGPASGTIDTGGFDVALAQALHGAGGLEKTGAGTLLVSASDYAGATTVAAGTLKAGAADAFSSASAFTVADGARLDLDGFDQAIGSLAGEGEVLAGAATLTVGGDATDTEFAGALSGTGTLVKVGAGRFALAADSAYSGTLAVEEGWLAVDADFGGAAAIVRGGVLGGTGSLATLTVEDGGTAAPGGPAGVLSVAGDAGFAAGSRFAVGVDAAGGAGRLQVGGTLALAGGTILVAAAPGAYAPLTAYTIATADGIAGRFAEVEADLAFLAADLDYTDTSVLLILIRNDIDFVELAASPNQRAVAAAIAAAGTDDALYRLLIGQNAAGARQAFGALSGEIHAVLPAVLAGHAGLLRDAIASRLRRAAPAVDGAATAWSVGLGGRGGFGGGTYEEMLAVAGVEAGGPGWTIGFGGGYGEAKVAADAASAEVAMADVLAYGRFDAGGLVLRSGATLGFSSVASRREVAFPGFSDTLDADGTAFTAQLFAEMAAPVALAGATLEPFAGVGMTGILRDGFAEEGDSPAALSAAAASAATAKAIAGLRVATAIPLGAAILRPSASMAWRHRLGGGAEATLLRFTGSGEAFRIAAEPAPADELALEAGFDLAFGATTLSADYAGTLGGQETHALRFGIAAQF